MRWTIFNQKLCIIIERQYYNREVRICFKTKTVDNPLRLLNRASKVFWDASYCLRELCEYHFHSKCFTRLEGRLAFLPKSTFLINLAGKLYLLYCFHSNWISFIYPTQYLIKFFKVSKYTSSYISICLLHTYSNKNLF